MTETPRALGRFAILGLALLAGCSRSGSTPAISVETSPSTANVPRAIAFDPPLGANGVDPARTSLSVTFDREMDPEGWAWVIENPATAPEISQSSWDSALRTNTAHVRLEPGRAYVVWVNSPQYSYFRDRRGVTAPPIRWAFSTAEAPSAGSGAIRPVAGHPVGAVPRVVRLEPPNGASGVAPGPTELRATFDRPMAEGWSWVRESPESFPEMTGDAYLTADGTAAVLPVNLGPGRTYVIWLNSEQHLDFRAPDGTALEPLRWTFSTAAR